MQTQDAFRIYKSTTCTEIEGLQGAGSCYRVKHLVGEVYECKDCEKGYYLDSSDSLCYAKDETTSNSYLLYVTSTDQDDSQQDGSFEKPFEFLLNAIEKAKELGAKHAESTVTITLLNDGDHYLLRKRYYQYKPFFSD